jgi:hypothetical protein
LDVRRVLEELDDGSRLAVDAGHRQREQEGIEQEAEGDNDDAEWEIVRAPHPSHARSVATAAGPGRGMEVPAEGWRSRPMAGDEGAADSLGFVAMPRLRP